MEKRAILRMEENYMRLTIEYFNPEYKSKICENIAKLENELKMYPEVIHRKEKNDDFFTSVEFFGDDYICDRTCGEFMERLLTNLNIKKCE